mmetsp:Transcript_939/g.5917  ORF Transcript_939/g.5917 Transcript_939/m.5917 type:complete len:206 (-) Transcript_939:123-740(-)
MHFPSPLCKSFPCTAFSWASCPYSAGYADTSAHPPLSWQYGAAFLYLLGIWMRGDVLDGICAGQNFICIIVWNLQSELFLERHHHLHSVQAVKAQIVDEMRRFLHLSGPNTKAMSARHPSKTSTVGSHPSTGKVVRASRGRRRVSSAAPPYGRLETARIRPTFHTFVATPILHVPASFDHLFESLFACTHARCCNIHIESAHLPW